VPVVYEGLGYAKTSFRFWLPLGVSAPRRGGPAIDPAGRVFQLHLNHIALLVADLDRSLDFYCRFFGFDRTTIQQYDDGVVFVRNADGFDLALKPAPEVSVPPSFLHFGFRAWNPSVVSTLQTNLAIAGVEMVEAHHEATYVSLKVRDPDGYVIETYWEPVP
jgi:catechol 2,3-dioxygenase-like lactoylglutathione lyase family enzyme